MTDMKTREIKFRIIHNDKIQGFEKLTEDRRWMWRDPELDSDKGERWSPGSYPLAAIRNQFTGLLDKNKNEIYEHDIVNVKGIIPHIQEVKFDEGEFQIGGMCARMFVGAINPGNKHCVVVGNIYSTPDLLTTAPR